MRARSWRSVRIAGWILTLVVAAVAGSAQAQIVKINDRKFPLSFCPFDLNGWQSGGAPTDLSFVAPAPSVRLTFSFPNYTMGFANLHLDNVSVVLRSEFPDNLANVHDPLPSGAYYGCYESPGTEHVPSFLFTNFTWPGPAGPLSSSFDADEECWTGDVYWDPQLRAPRDPESEGDATGGSLGVGKIQIFTPGIASASRIVSGLVPGQEYVVFAWWHAEQEGLPLALSIESAACVDADADGFVDCSGCAPCELQPGQTCGDCDDTSAAIRPSASDSTCDGIDQNCNGQADEGSAGGCTCAERAAGIVAWWPGDWNAYDVAGQNHGALLVGTWVGPGLVGDAFYFNFAPGAGIVVPDDDALEFNTQMTFEAWIRPDLLDGARPIIERLDAFESSYALETGAAGNLIATVANGTVYDNLDSPNFVLAESQWAHVAMTFDTGLLKLYVDGALVASKVSSITSIYDQGSIPTNIGHDGPSEFVGYIDELALYARALSAAEIRAIHDAGAAGLCGCADADGDGYGDGGAWCVDGEAVDCDDTDPARYPGAPERCNGLDDNCNGTLDEGWGQALFYRDQDMDGYGDGSSYAQACAPPPGYVIGGTDCNDLDATVHPGAPELCNGLDDDCDLQLDDGVASSTFYLDVDLDGFGHSATAIQACAAPAGYVAFGGDCDDADPNVNPGVADGSCNGIDENCNGQPDDGFPGGCQCTRPAPGLTNWWPGDGNASDVRGTSHGTAQNGATHASGLVGQAFSFDGVNDFVRVPGYLNTAPTAEVTVAFWQKVSSVKVQSTFSASAFVNGSVFNAHVPYSDGKVYWDFGNISTGGRLSYTPPVSLVGTWQHFALVASQSGNFMTIYRNGVLEAGKTGMTPFVPANLDLAIGGAASLGISFGGGIDELTVYDRALDAAEIRVIHALGSAAMCRCTDADLDGYGETAGLTCPGGAQPDCDDGQGASYPGAPELCNGVDDDCDSLVDNGVPAPVGRPLLLESKFEGLGEAIYWSPVADATGYDVVRGSLAALHASGGDFTTSTTGCVGDDIADLFALDIPTPAPGDATWHLVRAVNACGGSGSYDTGSASQQGSRDAEIAASPASCPP